MADFLPWNHPTAIRNCKKANTQCRGYQWGILFEAGGGYWSIVYRLQQKGTTLLSLVGACRKRQPLPNINMVLCSTGILQMKGADLYLVRYLGPTSYTHVVYVG